MRATCTENPEHTQFVTTAHVMQEWIVDREGNFQGVSNEALETTHPPDPANIWTCSQCGAPAEVKP